MHQPVLPPGLVWISRPDLRHLEQEGNAVPAPSAGREGAGATGTPQEGAQQGTGPAAPGGGMGGDACMSQLIFIVPLILIMYFLMIRPQQKQEKQRRQMLSELRKGDRVVTSGGMHGQVASLSDREVVLKLDTDGKLRVTFDRSAIGRIVSQGAGGDDQKSEGGAKGS